MTEQKWGLFVGNIKMEEYEENQYEQALRDLEFAYWETGIKHELKLI